MKEMNGGLSLSLLLSLFISIYSESQCNDSEKENKTQAAEITRFSRPFLQVH